MDIEVKYPEKKCYICSRTESDLHQIHDQIMAELDTEKSRIEGILNELLDNAKNEYRAYSNILKDIDDKNLEFSIKTVKTDLPTFQNMIPQLDELLRFYEEFGFKSEDIKLSDLKRKIENIDSLTMKDFDDPRLNGPRRTLEDIEDMKQNYLAMKETEFIFNLEENSVFFSDIFDTENPDPELFDLESYSREYIERNYINEFCSTMNLSEDDLSDNETYDKFVKYVDEKIRYYRAINNCIELMYTYYICPMCKKNFE